LERGQAERRRQIDQQHEQELIRFEDKWNNEDFLLRFAKPSGFLLEVKKIERTLVISKDFEKAESYRKQAAALELAESGSAQQRAEREMKICHERLLQRQAIELDFFEDACLRAKFRFNAQREMAFSKLKVRQMSVQTEIERKRNSRETLPPLVPGVGAIGSESPIMTPRTVQRFSAYKTCENRPKIVVKPLGPITKKLGNRLRGIKLIAQ
jgi:hypothetical protein